MDHLFTDSHRALVGELNTCSSDGADELGQVCGKNTFETLVAITRCDKKGA